MYPGELEHNTFSLGYYPHYHYEHIHSNLIPRPEAGIMPFGEIKKMEKVKVGFHYFHKSYVYDGK